MKKFENRQDILDDLLSTTTCNVPQEIEELVCFIERHAERRTVRDKKVGRNQVSAKRRRKKRNTKKKTTHYLSEEIFQGLDEAKEKIRKILPADIKTRVSKSQIVDHALKMILCDFETNGESSSLVKLILQNSQCASK